MNAMAKTERGIFLLNFWTVLLLVMLLLCSAIGMIYLKDLNRRLFIEYHELLAQEQHFQIEKGQLLLEEGAWSAQARIQQLAQSKLSMMLPSARSIVFVEDGRETLADND